MGWRCWDVPESFCSQSPHTAHISQAEVSPYWLSHAVKEKQPYIRETSIQLPYLVCFITGSPLKRLWFCSPWLDLWRLMLFSIMQYFYFSTWCTCVIYFLKMQTQFCFPMQFYTIRVKENYFLCQVQSHMFVILHNIYSID